MSSEEATYGLGKGRVEALSDGIFATVMTVLVLSLSVPLLASQATGTQLNSAVEASIRGLVPDILGYVLSFMLLAVMWVSHHNIFHYLRTIDRPLLWLNVVFLLSIGFVPFSTALLGRYPLLQLPVIIYGANIVGIALTMQAFLAYAVRKGLMAAEGHEGSVLRRIVERWRLGALLYGSAIALSFISTEISLAVYAGVLVFMVLQSAFGFRPPRSVALRP